MKWARCEEIVCFSNTTRYALSDSVYYVGPVEPRKDRERRGTRGMMISKCFGHLSTAKRCNPCNYYVCMQCLHSLLVARRRAFVCSACTASSLVARRHVRFLFPALARILDRPKIRLLQRLAAPRWSDVTAMSSGPLAASASLLRVIDRPRRGFSKISLIRSRSHAASVSRN